MPEAALMMATVSSPSSEVKYQLWPPSIETSFSMLTLAVCPV